MKKILVILLLIPVFLFAKTNNLTKNKPAVEIQLLRNATMKITYNNKTILIIEENKNTLITMDEYRKKLSNLIIK